MNAVPETGTATIADLPSRLEAEPRITIYGPEQCPGCEQAKRLFDRESMTYRKIDIEPGDENYRYVVEELGYNQAPVIIVGLGRDPRSNQNRVVHWGGSRMDMLMALTRLVKKSREHEDTDWLGEQDDQGEKTRRAS